MTQIDISTSFGAHPDTGNLLIRSGTGAIQQRIANLIMTDRYERPFRPTLGGGFRRLLFEQIAPSTAKMIRSLVEETIENHEPRIDLREVVVTPEQQRNRYVVTLVYRLNGEDTSIKQQITLTRER